MGETLPGLSAEYFYNIAALFSGSAYIMRNMLWLRVLLVIAATTYIITGIMLGIASMIGWNTAYLLINLFHIAILLLDRVTFNLPQETRKIYRRYFSTLSTREFGKLITSNDFCLFQDQNIISEHTVPDRLYVILCGNVRVINKGETIATLKTGDFIGEMSFLSKERASATAYAENLVQCAYWTHDDLDMLKARNINVYENFIAIIGRDLVRKLKRKNNRQLEQIARLDYVI